VSSRHRLRVLGEDDLKRLICCLDGTWNNNANGSILTNVAKLHHAISASDAQGVEQLSFYVAGIASSDGEAAKFVKGATGYGSLDRIKEAYEKLSAGYEAGDEVFLFGFSRGAFEARSLTALIDVVGLPKKNEAFSFDDAWTVYRKPERRRGESELAAIRATAQFPVRIKCVGVWDTVGNIGNPFISGGPISRMFEFHNRQMPASVEVGLHALSIDEIRGPFRPSLWTTPKDSELQGNQHIEQVWFAGSHADVGGGYPETELSDIALLWMAERATAKTGIAFDTEELKRTTRPDPLGPQHGVAFGAIFKWSGRLPYIRLIKQNVKGIPAWRRWLIGVWRSGKVPRKEVPVNESVHESVLCRYGQRVVEFGNDQSKIIPYQPGNVTAAMPKIGTPIPFAAASQTGDAGGRRRVKIFTVHGTFDHEAGWDNWSAKDKDGNDISETLFVRRLGEKLRAQSVDFDEIDHTQYNWSGGNSHDERRIAAIGLKKRIEDEMSGKDIPKEYSGGVYVIGHSHGGTVARLTMNLWAKGSTYYEPLEGKGPSAFKHDDECPVCRQERNGEVGPNTVQRPDGVITFGSPFVRFKKRSAGILTAKIGAWVFRGLALIAAVGFAYYLHSLAAALLEEKATLADALLTTTEKSKGVKPSASGLWYWLMSAWVLLWPVAYYWLLASWLPQRVVGLIQRWSGSEDLLLWPKAVARVIKLAAMAGLGVYLFAYLFLGGWQTVWGWLDVVIGADKLPWLWVAACFIFYWMFAIRLPGRMLRVLENEVMSLRDKLPKKYDPREDRPMAFLSYHTAGDEAGVHLRIFGAITWLVQTLSLSAASALAFGLVLLPILIPGAIYLGYVTFVEHNEAACLAAVTWIATAADLLTTYPAVVWQALLSPFTHLQSGYGTLSGELSLAIWVPAFLMVSILVVFVVIMPVAAIGLGIAYLVGMWLRGSGMVFGGERLTWTLANQIGVSRLANTNTKLRKFFISPEAWRKGEIAHCYYYKNEEVIGDVASHIANWSDHKPTPPLAIETWIPGIGRWLVVLLFILSIPLLAVVFLKSSKAGMDAVQQPAQVCKNESDTKTKSRSKKVGPAKVGSTAPTAFPAPATQPASALKSAPTVTQPAGALQPSQPLKQ
jgi:uncharacterized protein (DUF2235 family)